VRGALIPITFIFNTLTPNYFSAVQAASILGALVIFLSLYSVWSMEETFYKDLNYVEIDERKSQKIVHHTIN
jgi:MFS transporter, putative metabolite:H+ symporter